MDNIEYLITKSNRKSYVIRIKNINLVEIKAPFYAKKSEIEILIKKHQKKIEAMLENEKMKVRVSYNIGKKVPYNGDFIEIVKESNNDFKKNIVVKSDNEKEIMKEVYLFYQKRVRKIIEENYYKYTNLLNVKPNSIKLKTQKKRFGSCSSKGNINFNIKNAVFTKEVIEYIFVHELCHLIEPNHQKSFYRVLKSVMPDYKEREMLLKNQVKRISFDTL